MTDEKREIIIERLFGEMTSSSFAEGCEERIYKGLTLATDERLTELCVKYHIPNDL